MPSVGVDGRTSTWESFSFVTFHAKQKVFVIIAPSEEFLQTPWFDYYY